MSTHSLDITTCAAAMVFSMAVLGSPNLHLDGILLVSGMSREGARVIVVSEDGASEVLTEGLARFTLDLDLQTEYLISFERPGCISKELRFSTKVPVGYPVGEGFYFPFQVTLAPPAAGLHYTYAGPVGYIHFDKDINAFGYDTDYRIANDEVLSKRLELVRTTLEPPPIPVASPASMPVKSTATIPDWIMELSEAISGQDHSGTLAPTVSQVAPKVHVLEVPIAEKPIVDEPTRPAMAERMDQAGGSGPDAAQIELPPSVPVYAMALASKDSYYSKDVEADGLRVITTITVKHGIQNDEFRKVVSYYGGTTYFCNGRTCSEWTYNRGVAR